MASRWEIESVMLDAMSPHIKVGNDYYDVSPPRADDAISDILDELIKMGLDIETLNKSTDT